MTIVFFIDHSLYKSKFKTQGRPTISGFLVVFLIDRSLFWGILQVWHLRKGIFDDFCLRDDLPNVQWQVGIYIYVTPIILEEPRRDVWRIMMIIPCKGRLGLTWVHARGPGSTKEA